MDEISLFKAVRPTAPAFDDEDRQTARQRLLEAAADESPAPSGRAGNVTRLPGRRRVAIVAVAATAAVAAVLGVAVAGVIGSTGTTGGSPTPPSGQHTAPAHLGRALTATELVAYATRAAAAAPSFAPQPHQWIYTKTLSAKSSGGGGGFLFGPPNERQTSIGWIRADHLQWAGIQDGKIVISPVLGVNKRFTPAQTRLFQRAAERGSVVGWPDSGYAYLDSLPTDPARLRVIIAANVQAENHVTGYGDTGIFNAIEGLIESTVLPPKLYPGLYGVLSRLRGVHFDAATDLAGRPGLGLYMVQEGYDKQEIVINPKTYAYMGYEDVATRAHTSVALDGTRYIHKGQVLGWEALLASGVVNRPGQVP